MKNKKIILTITTVLFSICIFSGCIEFFQDIPTTYKPFPTKLSYEIDYGYRIQITGTGKYEVRYRCDIPEVLMGVLSYDLLYKSDYTTHTIVNNSYVSWNISGRDDDTYELGLTARITSESFLVSDLNGKNALAIEEIKHNYADIVKQYCNAQVIDHTPFIDPNNPIRRIIPM